MIKKILFRIGLVKGLLIILLNTIRLFLAKFLIRIIETIAFFLFKKIGIGVAGILGNSLLDTTSNIGVFASMFFSYFFVSILFLKIYDFFRVDFAEDAKEKAENTERSTFQKSRYFLFLTILFTFDSLLFILRVRPGHHKYNGVGGVKMWIFLVMSCMTFTFMLLNVLAFFQK